MYYAEAMISAVKYLESKKEAVESLMRAQSGIRNMTQKLDSDRVTPEHRSEMVQLAMQGESVYDIAQKYERNRDTVARVLSFAGIDIIPLKRRRRDTGSSAELGRALLKSMEQGHKFEHVIKMHKCSKACGFESIGLAGGLTIKLLKEHDND